MALLEAMSANGAMVYVTPITFLPDQNGIVRLDENFTRADENPISTHEWTTANTGSTAWRILSNQLYWADSCSPGDFSHSSNSTLSYDQKMLNASVEITYIFKWNTGSTATAVMYHFEIGKVIASSGTSAGLTGAGWYYLNGSIYVHDSTGVLNSAVFAITNDALYAVKVNVTKDTVKVKIWLSTDTEPTAWSITGQRTTGLTIASTYLGFYAGTAGTGSNNMNFYVDNLVVKNINGGYLCSGTVSGTGDKFSQALEYSRSDTANQNPIGYQFDAYVPGLTE